MKNTAIAYTMPVVNNTIMDTNTEVRNFHDTTMREAFRTAVEMMDGACFELIGEEEFAHVRSFLTEAIAYWMDKVGLHNKLAAGYLALSPANQRDDLSSAYFSAACINNRLAHFLQMTAENGAHAALKSLQVSVCNVIRDCLPSNKAKDDDKGAKVVLVGLDDVEGILSSPDYVCPDRVAESRQHLATFWQMLYEKPFIDVVHCLAQPRNLTRQELTARLLNPKATLKLIYELKALYTDILGDAMRVERMFLPVVAMAECYTPDPEYVACPKKLMNKLYRFTTENGGLNKFRTAFMAAIAA